MAALRNLNLYSANLTELKSVQVERKCPSVSLNYVIFQTTNFYFLLASPHTLLLFKERIHHTFLSQLLTRVY